jgi:anti-sigma regulatory factor (Ser/Thr protein kinase)
MGSPDAGQREDAGRIGPTGQQNQVRHASQARELTRGFLSVMAPQPHQQDVDTLLLVVSELVTNAVRHGQGLTGFHLRATRTGAIEVIVRDASPRWPRPRPLDLDYPGGFGLHLVQNVCRSVTVQPGPGSGKTVRAVVPYSPSNAILHHRARMTSTPGVRAATTSPPEAGNDPREASVRSR